MFFDPKRAFSENREKTVAGGVGYFEGELLRPCSFVAPGFLCGARCVRYACESSWFFALTSSFPVFPVSFRRRARYTAGVSSSDVKMKIT